MNWYLGLDIGSAFCKAVLLREDEGYAFCAVRSGSNYRSTAERITRELLSREDLAEKDLAGIGGTGSGAATFPLIQETIGDLVCTARGIHRSFPSARTVIDVAGQSTKVIRIGAEGQVVNFAQSEKCASGSGRFVEVIAKVLRIELEEFGSLSLRSRNPIAFSTGCAVFGESEAVTRVAAGVSREDIAAGVNRSLAEKIASLARKIRLEEPCALCGGGALNIGLVKAVEEKLALPLLVPEQPQVVAALGAAIVAGSTPKKTS